MKHHVYMAFPKLYENRGGYKQSLAKDIVWGPLISLVYIAVWGKKLSGVEWSGAEWSRGVESVL